MSMPGVPDRPKEVQPATPLMTLLAFTDGSKYRSRKYTRKFTRAGAGVFFPDLNEEHSCQVPPSLRQTSAAGEVCAVLLALRKIRHMSANIHIVSDNTYVVYVLSHKLEEYQQQDFSDVSHPELWREIVRELSLFPRVLTTEWTRAHTNGVSKMAVGNDRADHEAKQAARWNPSEVPPTLGLDPVTSSAVRIASLERKTKSKVILRRLLFFSWFSKVF